ncbi:hypothetical protein K1T71_012057 [Dendrolimus kikuchii]|uniref:Uncharacterized protein n=1 Tax=Dendrolimus kikuchii TaxID=765133 RepID=A0ACC1CKH3_9NEOP|nr:hypothetical protein K1T71_012057 [Dendrolimus kikuchii]
MDGNKVHKPVPKGKPEGKYTGKVDTSAIPTTAATSSKEVARTGPLVPLQGNKGSATTGPSILELKWGQANTPVHWAEKPTGKAGKVPSGPACDDPQLTRKHKRMLQKNEKRRVKRAEAKSAKLHPPPPPLTDTNGQRHRPQPRGVSKKPKLSPALVPKPTTYVEAASMDVSKAELIITSSTGFISQATATETELLIENIITSAKTPTPTSEAPRFMRRLTYVDGSLPLYCDNEAAVEWTKETCAVLELPEVGKLVDTDVKNIPKMVRCGILLPHEHDGDKMPYLNQKQIEEYLALINDGEISEDDLEDSDTEGNENFYENGDDLLHDLESPLEEENDDPDNDPFMAGDPPLINEATANDQVPQVPFPSTSQAAEQL